ncbi:MAG: NACHT domain-containing protein [Leptolyngbyaceae cyanobacterium bins.349]|nr:NACHT domain-containing protein [Leptolyngbyaceae cyanobacterium bins.349]
MAELKASIQGLARIKQARNEKGWTVEDPRWLLETSKVLDSNREWGNGIYADGVSDGTWKAFLYNSRKKGISTQVFQAFCTVLNLAWEEVVERTAEHDISLEGVSNDEDPEISRLVKQVRSRYCSNFLTNFSRIQLYTLKNIPLDSLFVPVFVHQEPSSQRESRQKLPPESALEMVERHPHLVILGKPGAGKSTFSTYLVTTACKTEARADRIPVLLRIRDVDSSISFQLLDELGRALGTEADITQQIVESGKVFLILDGLDEVSTQFRQQICQEISNFTRFPYLNRVVITCRTDVNDYKLPSTFERVEIADFDAQQQNKFIEKWFAISEQDPQSFLAVHLNRHPECTSATLINQVQQNQRLQELAKTPILLSLICLVYVSDGKLPEKRSSLYQRGLEILLEDWDERREIKTRVSGESYNRLTPNDKLEILTELARQTFDQAEDNFAFDQSKALAIISKYQNCSHQESLEILEGIAADHGLVFRSARRKWEFSHLTFQEYFFAQWFVQSSNNDWEKLATNTCNSRWREVFLLNAEMAKSADELLCLMKPEVDNFVAGDEALQVFLKWVNEKAISITSSFKPAAIRAYYFSLSHAPRHLPYLALDLLPDLDFFTFTLELELDRTLAFNLAYAHDFHHDINLYRAIMMAEQSDPEFKLKLINLHCQLVFQEPSKDQIAQLQTMMIKYRNIGHDWQFSDEQKNKLQQYHDANTLLVDCLNIASISQEVRQEIEDTLLLPIAEIEKRKKHSTNNEEK